MLSYILLLSLLEHTDANKKKKQTKVQPDEEPDEDLYGLLECTKKDKTDVIKVKYREATLKYHPDKCTDTEEVNCQSMFIKVTNAFEILTDTEKRKKYDKCGMKCVKGDDENGVGNEEDMFRQYYGREPDGKVKVTVFRDPWGNKRYQFSEEGEPGPENDLYTKSDVEEFDAENFKGVLNTRDEPWVILFYTPKNRECREWAKEFKELGTKFKGIAKIGALNCHKEKDYCGKRLQLNMRMKTGPKLKYFSFEPDAKEQKSFEGADDFDGGVMTGKSVGKWINEQIPDFGTIVHNKLGLSAWVEDIAGKRPTILLLTDKKDTPVMWKSLSREFRSRAALATHIRCDKSGVFKTEVQALMGHVTIPSIHAIDSMTLKPIETYSGPLKPEVISLWLRKMTLKKKTEGKTAVFPQWTQKRLEEGMCGQQDSQWCFLWIKSGKDQKAVEVMQGIAEQYKTDPLTIAWVSSELSPSVVDSFGVADEEDPVVAYRPKRGVFKVAPPGTHRSSELFKAFVDRILDGGVVKNKIKKAVSLRDEL